MKTIKRILTVVMLAAVVSSYANDIIKKDPSTIIATVKFENVRKGHQFTIKDSQGTILHRETIERNGTYSQKFDLTTLKDGMYTIELNKDFEIVVKPFRIAANRLMFLIAEETKLFKPVVRLEDNHLLISQMILNGQQLRVELFYEGELIHTEALKGQSIVDRIYKLSDSEKGTYLVQMTSGGRQFTEHFRL